VLHTPLKEFGWLGSWLAEEPKVWFMWSEDHNSRMVRFYSSEPIKKSGYFSATLPVGEFQINVRMPSRLVSLNHKFSANERGKAIYLGHFDLDITRRFVFLGPAMCVYGTVNQFSISDKFEVATRLFSNDPHKAQYSDVIKLFPHPIVSGETATVNRECISGMIIY